MSNYCVVYVFIMTYLLSNDAIDTVGKFYYKESEEVLTNSMENVKAAISGNKVSQIPYSFWTHFPEIDQNPKQLAEKTYEFCCNLDVDFIKNMPNGLFCVEDWGIKANFENVAKGGVAEVDRYAIEEPDDWLNLTELDVTKGAYGRELESVEYLLEKLDGKIPLLVTVFTPLTIAKKLAGPKLKSHLYEYPQLLRVGLDVITRTTIKFARAAIKKGCAGLFFANQMANHNELSRDLYLEWGTPYDLQVLNLTNEISWFNIIHFHGDKQMYDLFDKYPTQFINWHIGESSPYLEEYLEMNSQSIAGGLQRFHIRNKDLDLIKQEVKNIINLTEGRRLLLTPGCVLRHPIDIDFLKQVVEDIKIIYNVYKKEGVIQK